MKNYREILEQKTERDIDESKPIYVKGVKGMKSKSFTKKFKNWSVYVKWTNSDDYDDFEVYTVSN